MKITMYELLGMVKDGKAPKRIRVRSAGGVYDKEFYFDGDIYMYKDEYEEYAMTDDISIEMALNDEIEILEEEKKIPEETTVSEEQMLFNNLTTIDQEYVIRFMRMLQPMDYLKSKGDE